MEIAVAQPVNVGAREPSPNTRASYAASISYASSGDTGVAMVE